MADINYSRNALEAIANKALKQYHDGSLLFGTPQAVPIENIIENQYGLTMEYHCMRRDLKVLGQTVFENCFVPIFDFEQDCYTLIEVEANTIIIDSRLLNPRYSNRLRFSLGHELSHYLAHGKIFTDSGTSPASVMAGAGNNDTERQADYLCSAILMPLGQIKRVFYSLHNTAGVQECINQMAKLFQVAPKAMEIRLKEHHLI